jgi:glucose/arabinose dehydrogenase
VILDSEAVLALADPGHQQHRVVMAHLAGIGKRRQRGVDVRTVVPTSVRVESGWDRSAPKAAVINRLRIADIPLDRALADTAAAIASAEGVSVADAHLGAALRSLPDGEIVVLTGDPRDMRRVAGTRPVTAIRL